MDKISKIASKVFYSTLGVGLLLVLGIFIFDFFIYLYLVIGYVFIFLITIILLALAINIISNFRKFGFIKGVKEASIKLFTVLLVSFSVWVLWSYKLNETNRFNVKFINQTQLGISNITLIGRNAKTKIDSLAPNQEEVAIFKGKNINYSAENDYENEIRLLYYYDKKWREQKILSGFSRWRVISRDWEIKIHSSDSIELNYMKNMIEE